MQMRLGAVLGTHVQHPFTYLGPFMNQNEYCILVIYKDGMVTRHRLNTATILRIALDRHIIFSVEILNRPLFEGE